MKSARQEKILEIISRQNIETQSQLLEALQEEGFKSTQTTLSRDMREYIDANQRWIDVLDREAASVSAGTAAMLRGIFRTCDAARTFSPGEGIPDGSGLEMSEYLHEVTGREGDGPEAAIIFLLYLLRSLADLVSFRRKLDAVRIEGEAYACRFEDEQPVQGIDRFLPVKFKL